MRVKVTLGNKFWCEKSRKNSWTPNSNTTIMKKNKSMAQEV